MKRFLILLAACFLQLSLSAQTTTYLWSNGATTPTINVNPSVTTKYYVTITQDGVEYYDSLVVTVNSNQNKATISPTAVTSVCLNNAMAAITYTTTGATGIGTATGLPEGVSAAWSDNTITISGTPTESGTFNYSIPLTGGCGTVNATGTLTVTAPIVPSFTQVGPFVSGKCIPALPTTSNNSISGTWSPAINNTATTTYTFTPAAEQCASITTMTITINEPLQYTLTASDNSVCAGTTVTLSVSIGDQNASNASCGAPNVHNPNLTYGTMVDQDGNTYKTIAIGSQLWMAENLRTAKYRNGDFIPNVKDNKWGGLTTGAWAHYENDSIFECPYGKLYNWYAVADSRNVCPTGWHVPSDAEWITLINYIHPNSDEGRPVDGGLLNTAGGKMKSGGTKYWLAPNTDATNESGFSGVQGGMRYDDYDGSFSNHAGYWWSSTEFSNEAGPLYAWYIVLNPLIGWATRDRGTEKDSGFSVRCIKD